MTIVLVKKTLREAISHVQTSERGIGLLGFGVSFASAPSCGCGMLMATGQQSGTSGNLCVGGSTKQPQGVAVRFKVHDSTLCFVNSREALYLPI
jgi:hypothetical protein